MSDRADLVHRIIRHEGLVTKKGRHMPYQDSVGKWTIAHGRNLTDRGLSDDEAAMLLDHDLEDAIHECASTFPWFATQDGVRQQVLVELCYNLGLTKLRIFKNTLRFWAAGDYARAASNLRLSKWYGQVGSKVGQRGWRLTRMLETGADVA